MLGRPNLLLLYGARLLVSISICLLLLIATCAILGLLHHLLGFLNRLIHLLENQEGGLLNGRVGLLDSLGRRRRLWDVSRGSRLGQT